MKTHRVPRSPLVVSRLGYGCAMLGDVSHGGGGDAEALRAAERLVHTAYEQGIRLFDLADVYGLGRAESELGEVLGRSPGLREKIVIQTKCGIHVPPAPGWDDPVRFDLSRERIVQAAEGSLKRLRSDYVDVLLLHAFDPLVQPAEVAEAFEDLHRSGKVRCFGVSNHTPSQIELLKRDVEQPIVVNQMHLGLAQACRIAGGLDPVRDDSALSALKRAIDAWSEVLDYCRMQEMQVQAYCPLRANTSNSPALLNPPEDCASELKRTARMLTDLAERKGSTPSAVALAWLLRHPANIVPILGTTNPEHLVENCGADRIAMSSGEWYALFAATTGVPLFSDGAHAKPDK